MRKIHLSLLLCVIVFATGCPKYRPSEVDLNNQNSFVNRLNTYFRAKQNEYSAAIGSVPDGSEKARRIRNQFLEEVLPFIDEVYMDFITGIQAGRDRANFVADLVELGTSAAVGITNGERPLQILGIGLTAFRGGRRSADLNFYKEQTTPILISKMDGNRARVRATILTREKEGIDTYPIGAAISDIVDYYNAGTLVRAFTALQEDTAVQTKQSKDQVLQLKGVPISQPATVEFRNLSVAASDKISKLEVQLGDAAQKDEATKTLQKIVAVLEKDTVVAPLLTAAGISSKDTDGVKLKDALIDIRRSASLSDNKDVLNRINQAIADNVR